VDDSWVELRDVAIVGGGCYGTFYANQLTRARDRGRASFRRLLVVDRDPHCRFTTEIGPAPTQVLVTRDWDDFFDQWLDPATLSRPADPPDAIVPSPLMPHLMYRWLVRRARARWPGRLVATVPVPAGPGTPYDTLHPDGTRYLSYADWLCPTHCIEPATCPVTRAPRTWEMSEAFGALTATLALSRPTAGPVLFHCRHRVFGVGMFDASEVVAGDEAIGRAGAEHSEVDVLVGTVSGCHGAASLLRIG